MLYAADFIARSKSRAQRQRACVGVRKLPKIAAIIAIYSCFTKFTYRLLRRLLYHFMFRSVSRSDMHRRSARINADVIYVHVRTAQQE